MTVLVGKKEKHFILHQDAVCAKSKFFKAACSKQWLEGQERIVRLPEAQPATFQSYCHWIYSEDLPEPTCTDESAKRDKLAEQKTLIKLYLLGDILDDVQLRDKATSVLFVAMRRQQIPPSVGNMKLIYESTPSSSLLRKMIVDVFISRIDRSDVAQSLTYYPAEFIQEVAAAAVTSAPSWTWDQVARRLPQYAEVKKYECITID